MNAAETMLYMSNTAHQREVADLKAAGLNPVLSAGGSGASTPNISDTGSSATSAKAIRAAGKANPLNKALEIIDKHYNDRADWDKANAVIELFPEGAGSSTARNSTSTGSSPTSARAWYQTPVGSVLGGPVAAAANVIHGLRSGAITPRSALQVVSSFVGGREGSILRGVAQTLK